MPISTLNYKALHQAINLPRFTWMSETRRINTMKNLLWNLSIWNEKKNHHIFSFLRRKETLSYIENVLLSDTDFIEKTMTTVCFFSVAYQLYYYSGDLPVLCFWSRTTRNKTSGKIYSSQSRRSLLLNHSQLTRLGFNCIHCTTDRQPTPFVCSLLSATRCKYAHLLESTQLLFRFTTTLLAGNVNENIVASTGHSTA